MYWNVPSTVPLRRQRLASRAIGPDEVIVKLEDVRRCGGSGLGQPKSISFAPVFVSMMLPGFRSRWMTPLLCAFSNPSHISLAYFSSGSAGQRALAQPVSKSLAFEKLHYQKINAILVADVVERANVGMVQRRNGSSLAVKALPGFRILRKMRRKNLDGDGAVEASVERAIDLAHAARAQRRLNFVRTEFRARGQGHVARHYMPGGWRGCNDSGRVVGNPSLYTNYGRVSRNPSRIDAKRDCRLSAEK